MGASSREFDFDVAIVGGGPAGLSAAVLLGRACRSVVVFDHGKPRNYAARAVHGFLGLDGVDPNVLRERGRQDALSYGVQFLDCEVTAASRKTTAGDTRTSFEICANERSYLVRAVLWATGVRDLLPEIPGLRQLYGITVHHCPYCDGWEHRGKRLVALADGAAAVKLALSLRGWSQAVTACSHGQTLSSAERRVLSANEIECREERIQRLEGDEGKPQRIIFDSSPALDFDALFFSADRSQRSSLPASMGCKTKDDELHETTGKQETDVEGVLLAGDVDGDVQFAIVAAAEGAIAATAINSMLLKQETWTVGG